MTIVDTETGEVVSAPAVPPEIAAAIVAVKKQVRQLGSDERNEHGGYRYVSVDKFYERIGPLMAEAGLALLIDETETDVRVSETTDRNGNLRKTPWLFAQYQLAFMHASGCVSAPMRRSLAMPITGPQSYGAAQSYVEKQFLLQVFKIPTGEKDADETAQTEDAPSRPAAASRGRTAPETHRGTSGAPNGSSAPSDDERARDKWKEIAAGIDQLTTLPDLDSLDGSRDWVECHQLISRASGLEAADISMEDLRKRIMRRKGLVKMQADETAPLPI